MHIYKRRLDWELIKGTGVDVQLIEPCISLYYEMESRKASDTDNNNKKEDKEDKEVIISNRKGNMNRKQATYWLRKICAYLYLVIAYMMIVIYFSYQIRVINYPQGVGWPLLILSTIFFCIVFTIINFFIICRIISHKTLRYIETLLYSTLVILLISDLMYYYEDICNSFMYSKYWW